MNLINYEYIKLPRFSAFREAVIASDENNTNKLKFFEKIISTMIDYEKENRTHIDELYIKTSDLQIQQYIKIEEIPIARESILNAILFAVYDNDIEMLKKLRLIPIKKYELSQDELGDNLDYILNHSININEYMHSEREKLIYNIKENKIEKAYIFNHQENKNYQRLKLK